MLLNAYLEFTTKKRGRAEKEENRDMIYKQKS